MSLLWFSIWYIQVLVTVKQSLYVERCSIIVMLCYTVYTVHALRLLYELSCLSRVMNGGAVPGIASECWR